MSPHARISYGAASLTLSYAVQVDPDPLVVSVEGEDAVLGNLQVVISNDSGAAVMVNSISFVVQVGTGPALMQTTDNVGAEVSDTDDWTFTGPQGIVTSGAAKYTLLPTDENGYELAAGASVAVEISSFQTVLAAATTTVTIEEKVNGATQPAFGSFTVTTFPQGFFFNGLTANVSSGSGLAPVAQVVAGDTVTLTWNASNGEDESVTIVYTDPANGQQSATPSELGVWTSPALTVDTVFVVSVTASAAGGNPITISESVAVTVQNPELIAGTLTVNGSTTAQDISATTLQATGDIISGANMGGKVVLAEKLQAWQEFDANYARTVKLFGGGSSLLPSVGAYTAQTDGFLMGVVHSASVESSGTLTVSLEGTDTVAVATGGNVAIGAFGVCLTMSSQTMTLPIAAGQTFYVSFTTVTGACAQGQPTFAAWFFPLGRPESGSGFVRIGEAPETAAPPVIERFADRDKAVDDIVDILGEVAGKPIEGDARSRLAAALRRL